MWVYLIVVVVFLVWVLDEMGCEGDGDWFIEIMFFVCDEGNSIVFLIE